MLYVVAKALYCKMSFSKGILSSQCACDHGIFGEINKVKGGKQHGTFVCPMLFASFVAS